MDKYRAIPEGYMRVGELAKRVGVTVRTLQYYDKEGLLSPSAESDGGFRLYTDKDMFKLFHILTMKESGFSLNDIKKRLFPLETHSDVLKVLTEHTAEIRAKITHLSKSLADIETLTAEIERMETVDFGKISIILFNLQMKNKHYWVVKYFDDNEVAEFAKRMSMEEAAVFMEISDRIFDEAAKFQKEGVPPESEKGQNLAMKFWDIMIEMTGGDMDLLQKLNKIGKANEENHSEEYEAAQNFIGAAMACYFNNQGENKAQKGEILFK